MDPRVSSLRVDQATQLWQPIVDAVWQEVAGERSVFRGFPMWQPMHFRIGDTNFDRVIMLVTVHVDEGFAEPVFMMPPPSISRAAIGIVVVERENMSHSANLAIAIRPGCRGYGAGTAAFRQAIDYAFTMLHLNRVESFGYANNQASLRVQQKFMRPAGVMRKAGLTPEGYVDRVIFDLLRSEWEAGKATV